MRCGLWEQALGDRFNEPKLWSIFKLYQSSLRYRNDCQPGNATHPNYRSF